MRNFIKILLPVLLLTMTVCSQNKKNETAKQSDVKRQNKTYRDLHRQRRRFDFGKW